jgi:hypothetical protein
MRFTKFLLVLSMSITAFGAGCSAPSPISKPVDQAPNIPSQTDASWKRCTVCGLIYPVM